MHRESLRSILLCNQGKRISNEGTDCRRHLHVCSDLHAGVDTCRWYALVCRVLFFMLQMHTTKLGVGKHTATCALVYLVSRARSSCARAIISTSVGTSERTKTAVGSTRQRRYSHNSGPFRTCGLLQTPWLLLLSPPQASNTGIANVQQSVAQRAAPSGRPRAVSQRT